MKTVGTCEEVTITRHGKPVARLVPVTAAGDERLAGMVARLKTFRRGRRLGDGLSSGAKPSSTRCISRDIVNP